MIDHTLARFERRRRFEEYRGPVALVASWGVGIWMVANLIDAARLMSY